MIGREREHLDGLLRKPVEREDKELLVGAVLNPRPLGYEGKEARYRNQLTPARDRRRFLKDQGGRALSAAERPKTRCLVADRIIPHSLASL